VDEIVLAYEEKVELPIVEEKTEIMWRGDPGILYPSGVVRSHVTGKIVVGPRLSPVQRDPSGMSKRGWEMARQRAHEGLMMAAAERGVNARSPDEAWAHVIKARAMVALDEEKGRDGNDAARLIGVASGFMNDQEHEGNKPDNVISNEVALEMLKMVREERLKREQNTIDGTVV
jgi:hypothetical protein